MIVLDCDILFAKKLEMVLINAITGVWKVLSFFKAQLSNTKVKNETKIPITNLEIEPMAASSTVP